MHSRASFDYCCVVAGNIVLCLILYMSAAIMINPNYLTRDELEYELMSRGVTTAGDVQTLRKIFRAIQSEDVPSQIGRVGVFGQPTRLQYLGW